MKKHLFLLVFIGCFCGVYAQNDEFEPKWRLNVAGGMGYITAATSAEEQAYIVSMGLDSKKVKDMYSDIKSGTQFNADIHYLLNKNIGIGIKYAFFTTGGGMMQVLPHDQVVTLEIDDNYYINYIGTSLHVRSSIGDSRFALSLTISGGYAFFRGEENYYFYSYGGFGESQLLATGSSFSAYWGAGLEYFLNKNIALGVDLGYHHLSFDKLQVSVYDNRGFESYINPADVDFSRLDLSLGVKVYF